ncbi:2508_t:CDS:2, partial [Dentiscutata heterogama]
NIKNNVYPNHIKQLIYEYPNVDTIERVEEIIQTLKESNEPNINNWITFYSIPWICGSLNYLYSFISNDIWYKAPDNTNVAEACYSNVNQDSKTLTLENAI